MTCSIPRIKFIEKKMKYRLSDIERRILIVLQEGFPGSENPYRDVVEKAGIETKQLPAVLENLKREGKLRRKGVMLDHLKWDYPGERWLSGRWSKGVYRQWMSN